MISMYITGVACMTLPTSLFEKLMVFDGCCCGRASIVENGPVVEQIYNTLNGVLEVKHLKEQVCLCLMKDEFQNEVLSRTRASLFLGGNFNQMFTSEVFWIVKEKAKS